MAQILQLAFRLNAVVVLVLIDVVVTDVKRFQHVLMRKKFLNCKPHVAFHADGVYTSEVNAAPNVLSVNIIAYPVNHVFIAVVIYTHASVNAVRRVFHSAFYRAEFLGI